jgi:hypothetical protein
MAVSKEKNKEALLALTEQDKDDGKLEQQITFD